MVSKPKPALELTAFETGVLGTALMALIDEGPPAAVGAHALVTKLAIWCGDSFSVEETEAAERALLETYKEASDAPTD